VLVVDRDHLAAGEGQQMLDAGARFIDALPAEDRVAIWTIPPSTSGFQFSVDRDAAKRELRQAVGTYRPPMLGGFPGRAQFNIGRDEAILIEQGQKDVLAEVIARECPEVRPDSPHQTCPRDVEIATKTVASDWHRRAQVTLNAVENVTRALGSVASVKHLVLITSGPVNSRDELTLINAVADTAAAARVTIHALQVAEAPYQARTDQMRAAPAQIEQTLSAAYFLAGSTGGLAITPVSGDIGFGNLARQLSAAYELGFEAAPADRDGKQHRIEVRVRGRAWGSVVHARRTFTLDPIAVAPASPIAATAEPVAPPAPASASPAEAAAAETASGAAPLGTDPGALATRLAAYVERFERASSAIVAEERYVQVVHPWRGNPRAPEAEPSLGWFDDPADRGLKKGGPIISRRQLISDVLLVQTAGKRWTGYRDVAEVDGVRVRNRGERVKDLFLSNSPDREVQFQTITDESARYNLGDFRRTLNFPTVTLSFMSSKDAWRFEFKRAKDEKVADRVTRVLTFREKVRPTLIGTPGGAEIPIEGRIWFDADSGLVVRTELRFDRGGEERSLIRVDFGPMRGLDVLVPVLMWEWYEGANQIGRIGGDKTLVQCAARY
jgi:VWFA-related protein